MSNPRSQLQLMSSDLATNTQMADVQMQLEQLADTSPDCSDPFLDTKHGAVEFLIDRSCIYSKGWQNDPKWHTFILSGWLQTPFGAILEPKNGF